MRFLEQLMITVGLVDRATQPIQDINQQIRQTGEMGRQSMDRIVGGVAGLVAAGAALHQSLMPAIEMDRALSEVKSLGVVQGDLDQLSQTATEFSIKFGKSATEFIGAAYDIKSAMGDLSGDELAGITESSAVLAAATKADTATITSYMGTMYGVFKTQADAMGRDNFAKMVAGQTAQAVESFKTTGAEMESAFGALGSSATAMGVSMAEQMAVLGTLQSTMSGSEAATKYTAFIEGAIASQKKLGLSFVNARGDLLPMTEILGKLKDKIGDMGADDQFTILKDAFGSGEAVKLIQNLLPDVDGLAASINNVGQQTGMDKATQMAGAMTDQWERLGAAWFALRAGAGGSVLPTINDMVSVLVDGMAVLTQWTDMFPNLTEVVTWAAIGIGGLTAVMSIWSVIAGIAGLAMGAVSWPILAVVAAIAALVWLWEPLSAFFGGLFGALGDDLPVVFGPLIGLIDMVTSFFGDLLGGLASLLPGMEGVGEGFSTLQGLGEMAGFMISSALMMIFNPLEFIRRAIESLQLAWSGMVSFFTEGDFMAPVRDDFARLGPVFERVGGWFGDLKAGWQSFMDMLGNLSALDLLGSGLDWLINKLNMIPGINIKTSGAMSGVSPGQNTINQQLSSARTPDAIKAPSAPLMPQMAKVASQNSGKTVQFGDVHIKNEQGMDPQAMAEWEELQYGF